MLVGYARVSTTDQRADLQIKSLREKGCERVFDEQASGASVDRPQLSAALNFMREGDCLVVWKLDRLARSIRQLIQTVDLLDGRGVGLQSVTENIDTTSPSGRLVFHVFGALAEFERSIIRERTKAGLAAAKANGRMGGRPKALSEGDIQAAMAMLRDPGISGREVARRLSISISTLYRYIPGAKGSLDRQ